MDSHTVYPFFLSFCFSPSNKTYSLFYIARKTDMNKAWLQGDITQQLAQNTSYNHKGPQRQSEGGNRGLSMKEKKGNVVPKKNKK